MGNRRRSTSGFEPFFTTSFIVEPLTVIWLGWDRRYYIKPIIESNENEVFDVNNGLLLSGETGALFEKGYMSIDTDGTILPSVLLSDDMHQLLSRTRLNPQFMNEQRMDYLDFHRHQVFADR